MLANVYDCGRSTLLIHAAYGSGVPKWVCSLRYLALRSPDPSTDKTFTALVWCVNMIPNYRDKYDADAVFTPADAVTEQGDGLPTVPAAVILGYQEELTRAVREQARAPIDIVRSQRLFPVRETVGYVPIHEWGIGAPVTATVSENLIAAGAEAVAILGGCACLQRGISADVAILPTEAIRDEGVSYHYLPGETPVTPTERLVESLTDQLASAGFDTRQAPTWTTSAMYRETRPEVEKYRNDGVLSLGMESAAMWAPRY